jgi:chemotaxis protein methyltransferase CheR
LAIILAEAMGKFSFKNLKIEATDIDGSNIFGDIIAKGIYPREELERIPAEYLEKYFRKLADGDYYEVNDLIRSRLFFKKHDLLSLQPVGDSFSLVVCKNVLLHFQPAERVEVMKMFHGALASGGLFATEQTQTMPQEAAHLFEQVVDNAQLFRKIG